MKLLDAVISGSPAHLRTAFDTQEMLRSFPRIGRVFLLFERNPGRAFNRGVELTDSETVLFAGGDVRTDEDSIERLVLAMPGHEVAYASNGVPAGGGGFASGLFLARRSFVLLHPFPERPSFIEEIPWRVKYSGDIAAVPKATITNLHHDPTLTKTRLFRKLWTRLYDLKTNWPI